MQTFLEKLVNATFGSDEDAGFPDDSDWTKW